MSAELPVASFSAEIWPPESVPRSASNKSAWAGRGAGLGPALGRSLEATSLTVTPMGWPNKA